MLRASSRPTAPALALFAVYHFDVDYGGIGLGDGVPDLVLEHATAEERRVVAGWVREALPQGTDWSATFHRQIYGGFRWASPPSRGHHLAAVDHRASTGPRAPCTSGQKRAQGPCAARAAAVVVR